ncbi:MAG: adenylate/guanylate cyclase domain-containing protein [Fuerstiella sp.]|nr:adenylate/guanylate cyclase domain-containing protein [Fuerstiella sp.]
MDHQPNTASDAEGGEETEAATATVGCADLVSFTRLSRQLDDTELTAVVQAFESDSADIIHAASARLVKTLGDEVMFVSDSADQAAAIALNLHRTHNANDDLPQIRVGLATGAVLNRMGDVFGVTVNRASRFTALARPGTTVLDSATAELLSSNSAEKFSVRALTPRPVRGLGIVRPHALIDSTS